MISFEKLVENATDQLDDVQKSGGSLTSGLAVTQIEIAKTYAILALAMATRGG
jgi:hypothetical protein